jgi:hypothetical protein
MVVFGRWPLWAVIGMLTVVIAVALAAAGELVLAAALVAVVVIGGIYALRGSSGSL